MLSRTPIDRDSPVNYSLVETSEPVFQRSRTWLMQSLFTYTTIQYFVAPLARSHEWVSV